MDNTITTKKAGFSQEIAEALWATIRDSVEGAIDEKINSGDSPVFLESLITIGARAIMQEAARNSNRKKTVDQLITHNRKQREQRPTAAPVTPVVPQEMEQSKARSSALVFAIISAVVGMIIAGVVTSFLVQDILPICILTFLIGIIVGAFVYICMSCFKRSPA